MALQCLPTTRPIRTTAPTFQQEPVTLQEAQRQCGIALGNSYHDPDLQRLIVASRETVEADTGLVCYTGSHTWKFTYWPDESWFEIPGVRPVTAISSITYVDTAGTTQTWSSSNYVAPVEHEVTPVVKLAYGQTWPSLRGDTNGITVTFVAGHSSVLAIPPALKTLVLLNLHSEFLVHIGEDETSQRRGYDRALTKFLRSTYP